MLTKIIRENGSELQTIKSCIFTESVNANSDLRAGAVTSASIEVECFGSQQDAVVKDEKLTYYQVDENGNETKIGVFYATPKVTTKNTFSFIAYDCITTLDVDFSEYLNDIQDEFPMTLMDMVEHIMECAGTTLAQGATFPLYDLPVKKFTAQNVTCRQMLSFVAELACRYVQCDSDGNITFNWYSNANQEIAPSDENNSIYYKQDGLVYENYSTDELDRVAVYPYGTNIAAYVYPPSVDSGNTYDVFGNMLLINASAETFSRVAEHVYTTLHSLGRYTPCNVKLFPFNNPYRAGDKITVTDIQGKEFTTIVMNMVINQNEVNISSTGSKRYNGVTETLSQKLVRLTSDLEEVEKEVSAKVDEGHIISAINMSDESITIQADKLNLNGIVTANQYFKINTDGSIEALEGEIGKWMIEDFGLYKIMARKVDNDITYRVLILRSNDLSANWENNPAIYLYQYEDTGELPVVRKDGNDWGDYVSGDNKLLDINAPSLQPVDADYPRIINNSDSSNIVAFYDDSHEHDDLPDYNSGIFMSYVDMNVYNPAEYIVISDTLYIKPRTGRYVDPELEGRENSEIVWYDGGEVELEEGRTYELSIYVKHERQFETNAMVYLAHGIDSDKHIVAYSATNPEYKESYYIDENGNGKKIYRKYTSKLEYDSDVEGYYTNNKWYGWIDETGVMREHDDTGDWVIQSAENEWSKKTLTFIFNNNEYGQINNKTKIYFGVEFLDYDSISDSNKDVNGNIYDRIFLNGFSLVDANPTEPDDNWHEMIPSENYAAEEIIAQIRSGAKYKTQLNVASLEVSTVVEEGGEEVHYTTQIAAGEITTNHIDVSGGISALDNITSTKRVLSGEETASNASDILVPSGGVTFDVVRYVRTGNIASIYLRFKSSSAKTGTWQIATLKQGYRPRVECGTFTGSNTIQGYIQEGGGIFYQGALAANTNAYIKAVYMITQ